MAIQVIAWMASGFYFTIFPIAEIRGEHLTRAAEPVDKELLLSAAAASGVAMALDRHFDQDWEMTSLRLIAAGGEPAWRVEGEVGDISFLRLVDADSNQVLPQLNREMAGLQARNWLHEPTDVESIEWLEPAAGSSELRGRLLPVWKVNFARESLSLYLHPWTGEILARRTERWRLFDFLWMLHIMDYDTRDDFNHPLLQIASLLGLLVAASGLVYWFLTSRLFRRRRAPVSHPG